MKNKILLFFSFYGSPFNGDISQWDVKISKPESIFKNSHLESKTELWPKKWI